MSTSAIQAEIAAAIRDKKLVIGARGAMMGAKRGTIRAIIHSSTVPERLLRDLESCSSKGAAELTPFDGDAVRLGQVCGKPFRILVLGIKK